MGNPYYWSSISDLGIYRSSIWDNPITGPVYQISVPRPCTQLYLVTTRRPMSSNRYYCLFTELGASTRTGSPRTEYYL